MNIQPKYNIGDKVYGARWTTIDRHDPCPDCLGEKVWFVETPRKEKFELPCGTCYYGWDGSRGYLSTTVYSPEVKYLTIGSVRVDTADNENPVTYMCEETGVGSGTIHYECNLFTDRNDAKIQAEILCKKQQDYMMAQENKRIVENKKKEQRKPSWEKRRIKELEKEVKRLQNELQIQSK